jgi:zinc and cadmium transporter
MIAGGLLLLYCLVIFAASLFGGALPTLLRLSHTALQTLMSGVGGFMIGVAILHLLPHSHAQLRSIDATALWMLIGVVAMFFLIRVFHVHQHAVMEPERHEHVHHHEHEHHACTHEHHSHDPCLTDRRFSWLGLALGLALHTLIDGFALAAVVVAGSSDQPAWDRFMQSVAIFLAVALHKPLDSLSITTTMIAGGWTDRERRWANVGFALMCPLGALLFYAGSMTMSPTMIGAALGFSAGVFLCVSLADILPELSFHSHDRWTLSAALLIGIAAAVAIGFLEPGHGYG